ncbi:GntR family transcriptional regulator [Thalassococcus sp. S3]|uniref:GntR family transcriptional regulator n=1 Tax=Thalassococcus sp. S3 TaxID=2017482 RepID=UPI0010241113|nr:GntR family transcriptional regulator [Thalassococcus sp. S3]QBF32654.1 transcriptional regulator [Thalassococcus sp. S3]
MEASEDKIETRRSGDQSDALAAVLRRQIILGEIRPDARLRQEDLASRLDASRMPLREALRTLAAEGFVKIQPNRGAVVAPIDPDELREITELRVALETMAIRHAIPRLSNDTIDVASRIQDEIERSRDDAFAGLNAQFHAALYEASTRRLLLRQIANLHNLSDRYLRVAIGDLGLNPRSSREHRALLEACYARDVDGAVALLTEHITVPGQAVEASIRAART